MRLFFTIVTVIFKIAIIMFGLFLTYLYGRDFFRDIENWELKVNRDRYLNCWLEERQVRASVMVAQAKLLENENVDDSDNSEPKGNESSLSWDENFFNRYKNLYVVTEDYGDTMYSEFFDIIDSLDRHYGDPASYVKELKSPTNIVKVYTGEEFIQAIRNDVTIIIENDELNLSKIVDELPVYKISKYDNEVIGRQEPGVYREEYNEGIILHGLYNITIQGMLRNNELVHICTEDETANVISMDSCSNIKLSNLRIGHLVEKGTCKGAVILIKESNNIEIDNCKLYGCGIEGLYVYKSNDINVLKTEIYECSENSMRIKDSTRNVLLSECLIRDCPSGIYSDLTNSQIEIKDSYISRNSAKIENDGPLKFTNIKWIDNVK